MQLTVCRTDDFALGDRMDADWGRAATVDVLPIDGRAGPLTRVAVLYSTTGLYARFTCQDGRLACTGRLGDGDDLWSEDVVEAFLWPDESQRAYFEYELSPLGPELPLLVSNHAGTFMGWSPWHYDGDRRVRRATAARDAPGGGVEWTAAFFVPFALLQGLGNVPPRGGTRWRANFCRIDHDTGTPRLFSWSPGITGSFHAIDQFGTLVFE